MPPPQEPAPLHDVVTPAKGTSPAVTDTPKPPSTVEPSDVTLFAEGWELRLGNVVGATVLYDPYLLGVGLVSGEKVEMLGTSTALRELGIRIIEVVGEWPNSLWMRVQFDSKREVMYRWNGTNWESSGALDFVGYRDIRLLPGQAGSTWAVLVGVSASEGFQLNSLPPVGNPLRSIRWNDPNTPRARLALPLVPSELGITRDGGLFVFGEIAEKAAKPTGLGIGSWHGDTRTSGSGVLPLSKIEGFQFTKLCHGLDDNAYLLGGRRADDLKTTYVAKWNGQTLSAPEQVFTTGDKPEVEACTVSPNGALWLALNKSGERWLVTSGAKGKKSRIPLPTLPILKTLPRFEKKENRWQVVDEPIPTEKPQGYVVTELRVTKTEEVWLTGYRSIDWQPAKTPGLPHEGLRRNFVLYYGPNHRSASVNWSEIAGNALDLASVVEGVPRRKPLAPIVEPSSAPVATVVVPQELPEGALTKPEPQANLTVATPQCQSLFLAIYNVLPVTPKDYDYPATREALRGHAEFARALLVEVEHQGQRFFGALVDDYTLGQQLERHIQKTVKGSTPRLLCGRLAMIRSVPIGAGRKPNVDSKM